MLFVLSIGVLLAAMALAVLAWRRSRHRGRTFWTESARLLLIVLAVVLLWQPETEFSRPSRQRRQVVVLVDRSASMQTEDVVTSSDRMQRREAADEWIEDASWDKLQPRFTLVVRRFAAQRPSQPDLAAAIASVA